VTGDSERLLELLGTWVRVLSLRSRLLGWYDRDRRDLPWRRDRDPYRVLVSELMLQQTRVDVVVPYFERWTDRWPDFASLAAASEDEVLAAWSGLGYYRRARALLAIARTVVGEMDGRLPEDPDALRALPGIGPYTSAAVASIAFDRPVPVVDGNVERVLCRLLCDRREASAERKRCVHEAARRLVTGLTRDDPQAVEPPEGLRAADWNQALMELGATICTPAAPACVDCPWARTCVANRAGLAEEIPRKRPKGPVRDVTLHSALVRRANRFLLVQRPEGSLLSGLWELPTTEEGQSLEDLRVRVAEVLAAPAALPATPSRSYRHSITNRRITVHVHEARLESAAGAVLDAPGSGAAWVRRVDLRDFGVSSMTRKALAGSEPADEAG
jgi:A/G-specific adenine glycosylase